MTFLIVCFYVIILAINISSKISTKLEFRNYFAAELFYTGSLLFDQSIFVLSTLSKNTRQWSHKRTNLQIVLTFQIRHGWLKGFTVNRRANFGEFTSSSVAGLWNSADLTRQKHLNLWELPKTPPPKRWLIRFYF